MSRDIGFRNKLTSGMSAAGGATPISSNQGANKKRFNKNDGTLESV